MAADFINIKASTPVILENQEVIHFKAYQGVAVCIYTVPAGVGGAFFLQGPFSNKGEPELLEAVFSLLRMILPNRATPLRAKIIGRQEQVHAVNDLLRKHRISIENTTVTTMDGFEVFFHTGAGRLRFREFSQSEEQPIASPLRRPKTKVLIVDDSRTLRKMLTSVISQDAELEVVGAAELPSQVEGMLIALKPDVITLDINMPEVDGVSLMQQLLPKYSLPFILLSALRMEDGNQVLQGLEAGAVDYIEKPSFEDLHSAAPEICEKIKTAARAKVRARAAKPLTDVLSKAAKTQKFSIESINHRATTDGTQTVLAIGASTGGTEAIRELLLGLPSEIPPIVIVQHIPAVFSAAFAKRLNEICPFEVLEAQDGNELLPNRVLIAPGGKQMEIVRQGKKLTTRVYEGEKVTGHKPSVDVLFHSVAAVCKGNAVGTILTGMGGDGAKGLLAMRHAGAHTIAQDEASCVVFGMPAVAIRLGAAEATLPLDQIAGRIIHLLSVAAA